MGGGTEAAPAMRAKRSVAVFLSVLLMALPLMLTCLAAMLLPEATGENVYKKSGTTVDASNASQGYIMVKQNATGKKLKVQISLGNDTMTYNLNGDGEYEVFPLQLGNGKYRVQVFRNISGDRYTALSSISFKAELQDEKLPFLYPNQYVNYEADSLAVVRANELCGGMESGADKANAVYAYVVKNITYDYILAKTVKTGYVPDLDSVVQKGMGICFDISALIACMLRSQGVPTQLVIGYADSAYHAWNLVYMNDQWLRCDATSDICALTVNQYTTERRY